MVTSRFVPTQFGIFPHRQTGRPTEDSADRLESECDLSPSAGELVSDICVVSIGWGQTITAKVFNHHPPPLGG